MSSLTYSLHLLIFLLRSPRKASILDLSNELTTHIISSHFYITSFIILMPHIKPILSLSASELSSTCVNRLISSMIIDVMSFAPCCFILPSSSNLKLIISALFYFSAVIISSTTICTTNTNKVGARLPPSRTPCPCSISLP